MSGGGAADGALDEAAARRDRIAGGRGQGGDGGDGGAAPGEIGGGASSEADDRPPRRRALRPRPQGAMASTSYRSVEYVLMSADRSANRHLRRLLGSGGGGDEDQRAAAVTHEALERAGGDEAWAKEFVRLLLYDERMTNVACMKSKNLKKELVEAVAVVERVEEMLATLAGRRDVCADVDAGRVGPEGARLRALIAADAAVATGAQSEVAGAGVQTQADDTPSALERSGEGLLMVDLCSGKGAAGLMLALRFPRARVVGVDARPPSGRDLHEGMLDNLERVTGDIYDEEVIARAFERDVSGSDGASGATVRRTRARERSRICAISVQRHQRSDHLSVALPCAYVCRCCWACTYVATSHDEPSKYSTTARILVLRLSRLAASSGRFHFGCGRREAGATIPLSLRARACRGAYRTSSGRSACSRRVARSIGTSVFGGTRL